MRNKFKEILEHARKEKSITCFEYPIYHICLWISSFKYFFGVFGLVLANSYQKESELDYKTEKILSILGIVLGIMISAIFCIVLISQLSGIH